MPASNVRAYREDAASRTRRRDVWGGELVVVSATVLVFAAGTARLELGPLSQHMATHIILMNCASPLLALTLARAGIGISAGSGQLASATLFQLLALWGFHAPSMFAYAHGSVSVQFAIHTILFASALWFWMAVVAQTRDKRWRALVALLLTGKLFCLLGVILTLSPRHLYPLASALHAGHDPAVALWDQQLAGLMMLAACPVTYVVAGVVIAARWLDELTADYA